MSSENLDIVICRTCITECEKFKSLHKKGYFLGELTTLGTLLSYFTDIEISPDDDLMPSYICLRCVQHLTSSFVFKRMVVEANEELRSQNVNEQKRQQYKAGLCAKEDSLVITKIESFESTKYLTGQRDKEDTNSLKNPVIDDINYLSHSSEFILPDFQKDHQSKANKKETCKMEKSTHLIDSRLYSACSKKKLVNRTSKIRSKKLETKLLNPDWQCKICCKQLSNQHSFKYHMQLHSDETPYLCSLCGEGFKTRNSYEGHLVIHDPNNPNTCLQCGKAYRQSSSLRTHMLTHTGEKPFRCGICGKGMTQKSGYKKHMLIHTGEKPHTCDICGRAFRYSSNLIAHKRCHSGEKSYKCPLCEKNFPTIEHMKRHIIIHTENNTFSCNFLHKKF